MRNSRTAYAVIGVVILFLLAYAVITYAGVSSGYGVVLQLTDPPQVPNGTQNLNIAYSGVQVHVSGATNWVSTGATGTVDLLAIVNLSKTLGSVTVPKNSTIDLFRFNITNANIVVNNTQYPVTLPNKQVLIRVKGKVNATSSLLADLSPTIIAIITNSSAPIFVLVPSVRAVIIPGVNISAKSTGAVAHLNFTARKELEEIRPNITITSATLGTSGNVTHVAVTVKNKANTSVVLRHLLVRGNESMTVNLSFSKGLENNKEQIPGLVNIGAVSNGLGINSAAADHITLDGERHTESGVINSSRGAANTSRGPSEMGGGLHLNRSSLKNITKSLEEHEKHHRQVNASELEGILKNATHNASSIASLRINESRAKKIISVTETREKIEAEHEHFGVVNFLIGKNATLTLPFSEGDEMREFEGGGYNLSAGQSVTLTFNGVMSLAHGRVVLSFKHVQIYKVGVQGEEGARARVNVTAS